MSLTKKRLALSCIFLCMILLLSCILLLFSGCKSLYKFSFDYEIDVTECIRGSRLVIKTTITNESGFTYTYYGPVDDFSAHMHLYTDVDGETYIMQSETVISPANGKWQIENGKSSSSRYWITVPSDAPIGEYNLILTYKDYRVEYENVLTVNEGRFDFTFDYGLDVTECVRGSEVQLSATITNDSGYTYSYLGFSSSFRPYVCLYIEKDGFRYEIPIDISNTTDLGYHEIENGESRTINVTFEIPLDAPLGEYNLILSYKDKRVWCDTSVKYEGVLKVVE